MLGEAEKTSIARFIPAIASMSSAQHAHEKELFVSIPYGFEYLGSYCEGYFDYHRLATS